MENLIFKLRKNKIGIHLDNGALRLDIPKNLHAREEILAEIKNNKAELIKFIENTQSLKATHKVIEQAPEKAYYPLSSAQKRMYFLYEFDKLSLNYNMPLMINIEGGLDLNLLSSVFNQLVVRHESLRTVFGIVDEEPVQKILQDQYLDIEVFKISESEISKTIDCFVQPFDLHEGPLIRVGVIELTTQKHILMLDMHHIITDGVSESILMKEFMALYHGESLLPLTLQYKDYSEWQQSDVRKQEISSQRDFWLAQFDEELDPIDLPTDFKRPRVKSQKGDTISFTINKEEAQKLKAINDDLGSTSFMMFLSLYYILLYKLTGQEDLVIGTPVAGREHEDLNSMIGMFVNTLPLRNRLDGDTTFRAFLSEIKTKTLSCIHNQSYQYESLIDDLKIERDTSRNPLFDVSFSYQNFIEGGMDIPGLKLSMQENDINISKFDMNLLASEVNEEFSLSITYSTSLFSSDSISNFVRYYKRIVASVISDVDIKLSSIDILSQEEKSKLVNDFNDTAQFYPNDSNIVSVFSSQVSRFPDRLALLLGSESLSYASLDSRSNQVAHGLVSRGVKKGDIVGLMLDRSIDMIVGMLGILKSGGVYLPLDSHQPKSRVLHSLEDSGSLVLLSNSKGALDYSSDLEVLDIGKVGSFSESALDLDIFSDDSAYVIYTSGSTGRPKGVQVGHQSVINLVWSQQGIYDFKDEDRVLQVSEIVFDASVEQIWTALLSGVSLVLIDKSTLLDSHRFNEYLDNHKVSHLLCTPTFIENIGLGIHSELRTIVLGGEVCKPHLAENLLAHYKLYNAYGPTEATVISTIYEVTRDSLTNSSIPIGRPIANTQAYILGNHKELLPIGVTGELYVGGDSLAQGYLHNDVLTKERFVDNPYHSGELMYRTGDLARWLADGTIEYLGRIDEQIKIRGFRIELGEIESHLRSYEGIDEVVLDVKDNDGDGYLVGYYTSLNAIDKGVLKQYLSDKLPEYMIPNYYVHLSEIPSNSSGKVDKKRLPVPELDYEEDYVGPSNDIEREITRIWSEVLSIEEQFISVDKSFFELGGHSLRAIVLVNKIAKEFNVQFPLEKIFENPTIKEQAGFIDINEWLSKDKTTDLEREMINEIII